MALAPSSVRAQSSAAGRQNAREEAFGRVLGEVPALVSRALEKGHTEFFRLLETLELFRFESEIDRFVGPPRTLHDSTSYKLSLLPFHIRYPVYRQLIDQMTRLDTLRSRSIHTVTPDSTSLIDIRIQPVTTLEEFSGQGAGNEVQRSLLNHFTAREIADLTVFGLAQQPFFPDSEEGWRRVKRRVARSSVPIALGTLATGAVFEAGALSHSGPLLRRGDAFQLRYYGGFRGLGIGLHPLLRGGVAIRSPGFEAAAGISDQVQPAREQPDSAAELALRTGWLNNIDHPAGMDAFFEGALRRSMFVPSQFNGDRTTARVGFFFRGEQPRWLPHLTLRGSAEAESDLDERLHIVAAVGLEPPRGGIATMLHGSLVPTSPTHAGMHDARLNLFLVGTMEPVTAAFEEDMASLARQTLGDWSELAQLDARHAAWERGLRTSPPVARSPAASAAMLAALQQLLNEREDRLVTLAHTLNAYLESRQRAYAIFGWPAAIDELHGPLAAATVLAIRGRILARLYEIGGELAASLDPLLSLKRDIEAEEEELRRLASVEPGGPRMVAHSQALEALLRRWEAETERVRGALAARDGLRAPAARILDATGGSDNVRTWDGLDALVRLRLARLSSSTPD